jgi:hypothetical protein
MFNSLNYERRLFPEDTIRQSLYDQMVLPMNTDGKYNDVAVRFDYLGWWPIYFDSGQGGLIKPESVSTSFLPMIGLQRYSTTYDISFPVVITIADPNALKGQGYTFKFALEANIRNNEPMDKDFAGLEGVYEFQASLLCNPNQRNSGNISVKAVDFSTGNPLPDVQVTYTCGTESCTMGATDERGNLETQFPVCYNGILSFLKQDYFASAQYLTTSLNKDDKLASVQMYPYFEKKAKIMKWLYSSNQVSANPVDIDAPEHAVIILTKIKENAGEPDVVAFADIFGDQTELSTIRLVPGTYEASINVFLQKPVIVPAEKRKVEAGVFASLFGGEKEYLIPEVKFDNNYPSAGAVLNEKSGYLSISANNLYGDSIITFYSISPPLPKKIEDLDEINKFEEHSIQFRQQLEPTYSK